MTGFQPGDKPPEPPDLRTESAIVATWEGDRPLVTVLCSTYRHRDLIGDAMRGILGQVTSFPFEVLVRDDASDDGTTEIVREFGERFPNIVRPVLETENRWMDPSRRSFHESARGTFIARCDGDDYWTDPAKLDTQVATLRMYPEAVLSHHRAIVVEGGAVTHAELLPPTHCRDFSREELVRAKLAVTSTLLYRNVETDTPPQTAHIRNRDMFRLARLGQHGSAKWEDGVSPTVRRLHLGGSWSQLPAHHRGIESARSYFWIGQYFLDRDRAVADHFFARGLAWYAQAATDAGGDPGRLFSEAQSALAATLASPEAELPPVLHRLIRERDAAVAKQDRLRVDRDRAREKLVRLRDRRAVKLALRLARIVKPATTRRHRIRPQR